MSMDGCSLKLQKNAQILIQIKDRLHIGFGIIWKKLKKWVSIMLIEMNFPNNYLVTYGAIWQQKGCQSLH